MANQEFIARIVAAYTSMDQRSKRTLLAHMELMAKKHPEKKPVKLRLVDSNFGK